MGNRGPSGRNRDRARITQTGTTHVLLTRTGQSGVQVVPLSGTSGTLSGEAPTDCADPPRQRDILHKIHAGDTDREVNLAWASSGVYGEDTQRPSSRCHPIVVQP
jgi:hypothetical protein